MKSAAFDYCRPSTIGDATALLAQHPSSKVLAGGQTLGPMLNLRLVRPAMLIDITRIPELTRIEETRDAIILGACITHGSIEDGRTPDVAEGALRRVARGIAYRAIRTRGTIGGSLAHADPAADWLSCLLALDAAVLVAGAHGRRSVPISAFVVGPLTTVLESGEIIEAVRIPRVGSGARFGYAKLCRKTGEFAHAIGAALLDPARDNLRLVAGATEGVPILLEDGANLVAEVAVGSGRSRLDRPRTVDVLRRRGVGPDAYQLNAHFASLERALDVAHSV